MICDFCLDPRTGMLFYPHRRIIQAVPARLLIYEEGTWSCCEVCDALLKARDIEALIIRARAKLPTTGSEEGDRVGERLLRATYWKLLDTITGPPRWVTEAELEQEVQAAREKHRRRAG